MGKNANTFNRRAPHLQPIPTTLVICEDEKSAKKYLEDACSHFRIRVKVEVSHCGRTDPKGIVEEAIRNKKQFEKIFCVLDRDSHLNFNEALNTAKAHHDKVKVIASYPCFEYWLVLHFKDTRRQYSNLPGNSAANQMLGLLKSSPEMQDYEKGSRKNLFDYLLQEDRLKKARALSKRILEQATREDNLNPSTEMHYLIEEFEKLSII